MSTLFTPGTKFGTISSSTSEVQKIVLETPSKRPLSPSITAQKKGTGSEATVTLSCIVFVSGKNAQNDDGNTPNKINFNINYLVTDINKVSIYISKDSSFIPSDTFYPYVVEIVFKPSQIANLTNTFNTIKVINWDADPEGSRGTETTVLSGAG